MALENQPQILGNVQEIGASDIQSILQEFPFAASLRQITLRDDVPAEGRCRFAGDAPGAISLVRPPKHGLRGALLHAWAHNEFNVNHRWNYFFQKAALLERGGYVVNSASTMDVSENWASALADVLMGDNADSYVSLAERAPIRALIAAIALSEILNSCASENDMARCDSWRSRAEGTVRQSYPIAMETLRTFMPSEQGLQTAAMSILLEFGTEFDIKDLPSLQKLDLAYAPITPAKLSKITHLHVMDLDLAGIELLDRHCDFLRSMDRLRKLSLANTDFRAHQLDALLPLADLQELNLKGTKIDHTAMGWLCDMKSLRLLNLESTGFYSENAAKLGERLPNCMIFV